MESHRKSFLIRPFKNEDVEEVARLVSKAFSEREPATSHMKIDADTFYSNFGKNWAEQCSKEDLSFVCLDENNEIVGCRLSLTMKHPFCVINPDENGPTAAFKFLVAKYTNAWFEKHPEFVTESEDGPKCLLFLAVVAKDGCENKSIATKLIEYSLNHAKIKSYEYVYVIASNPRTQHIFKNKYKFNEVLVYDYDSIVFKDNHLFKGITNSKQLIGYELDLKNWDISLHPISNRF